MAGTGLSVSHSVGHMGGVASALQELTWPKPLLSKEKMDARGAREPYPSLKGSEQAPLERDVDFLEKRSYTMWGQRHGPGLGNHCLRKC